MKNIFNILNFENFKKTISNIIVRFPITLIVIVLTCILFFIGIHWTFTQNIENDIIRAIFSLIITYFLSVWIYLTSEKFWFEKWKKYLFQLIPVLFWIGFFISFDKDLENFNNIVLFILTLIWIISYIFIAPYTKELFSDLKKWVYYSYFYAISIVFLKSAIFWWVLFALWNIWIMSVIELFDLQNILTDDIIQDWATISLSFITPIFALTQVPDKTSFWKDNFIENAFFSFLIKYVWVPFIYVYFIILYAYSIKVLINFWDWPKWEVSWMTIWFSIFWYLAYIFSYVFEEKNKFIKFFRTLFPFAVIPQLFMLFYAIWLRIGQYDITTNRYFVVVFWVWLLVLSLYFIISKKKSLSFIPALLTLFTIIISVWPWSVYNLPKVRQTDRLVANLQKANILQDSKIIPLKNHEDITPELSKDIYSGIEYVCDYDNCDKIKELFSEKYKEFEEKHKIDFEKNKKDDLERYKDNEDILKDTEKRVYNGPSKWEIVNEVTDYIKVRTYFETTSEDKIEFLNFHIDYKDNDNDIFPMDITWYNKIYRVSTDKQSYKEFGKLDAEKEVIEIIENGNVIEEIDIKNISQVLYDNYKKNKIVDLEKEELTFEVTWKNWIYILIFESISIKNPLYKWQINRNYNYSNGYIIVK